MLHPPLSLLIALTVTVSQAAAEPLEPPIVQTAIRVEREQNGACAEIRAGKPGSTPVLIMSDICHGWSTTTCADKLFFRGVGVIEDQGRVLLTEENRAVDAVRLVDQSIRTRWPRHEHLHLTFGAPRCDGIALVLPFSGSHMQAGTNGSAAGFAGEIRVRNANDQQVTVQPKRKTKVR
ncbi:MULTISPECIES: hypothetical protein [Caulobacter]|jgi:hypothetical protein|uniref:hypothetical protein n=1 Tax=Caulobacter TaxID=75 RepID=UPI00054F6B1E|nr:MULTISPECIES: hypothetical protein [Caulobacter]MBQ1561864.1 hypothetical protein [Caulobacter sp.]